jgi:hypothetical protein
MERTIMVGGTFLHLIKINWSKEILTPERSAVNQSPIGIK